MLSPLRDRIAVVAATALPAAPYASVPHTVMRDPRLLPRDMLVWLELDRAGRGRGAFRISAAALAKRLGCSPETVKRSFRRLREAGHLHRKRCFYLDGDGQHRDGPAWTILLGVAGRALRRRGEQARPRQGGLTRPRAAEQRRSVNRCVTDDPQRPTRKELLGEPPPATAPDRPSDPPQSPRDGPPPVPSTPENRARGLAACRAALHRARGTE